MQSRIAEAIALRHPPVALLWSDEKPEGAMQFEKEKWACAMWLTAAAARGKTAVCDRETFGCVGGGVGMGFGNQYVNFPGGEECFCRFLSSGNAGSPEGEAAAAQVKPFMQAEAFDNFLHGERYLKDPQRVHRFIDALPIAEIPARYVVFKPLSALAAGETPQVVIFFANPDQLSALVVLANYGRGENENVIIPFAAGCQNVALNAYREGRSANPRAVVGLTDLSARVYLRKQLGDRNLLTFAAPFPLYREMEANVEGSFLQRHTWQELLKDQ